MAVLNHSDMYPSYVVIHADGQGAPLSFPLRNDGLVRVTSLRLSLRFGLSEDFMFLDEEVYDSQSGNLINNIEQFPVCDGDSKEWLLRPRKFRIYGMIESVMATSTELVTPHQSSVGTVQLTPATRVKVEHTDELITILSDDSDGSSPAVASPIRSPLINSIIESKVSYSDKPPSAPRWSSEVS
jgi:hypothetical protein